MILGLLKTHVGFDKLLNAPNVCWAFSSRENGTMERCLGSKADTRNSVDDSHALYATLLAPSR